MDLHDIVGRLGQRKDPRLLVGLETSDDAAVYLLNDDLALVQTADFITPIVDDPFLFGQIAAANALSDIYAMGGKPITALNLCCFPQQELAKETLSAILEGGLSKVAEAGALVVGGHTVRDKELKFGLAATGVIHPKNIKSNRGAKPGDAIVLTKPIGTGILSTALKKEKITETELKPAISAMAALNQEAAEIMVQLNAGAATDITGFGLAVHLLNVAKWSGVASEVRLSEVPLFDRVRELSTEGIKTGITFANEQAAFGMISFDEKISREDQLLVFDPQTSGGLAIFINEKLVASLLKRLGDRGVLARRIGGVSDGDPFLRVVA